MVDGDYQLRVRSGTLHDIWLASVAPPSMKKSLNGLNFPNLIAGITESKYATDVRAFLRTCHDARCSKAMPIGDISFGLAATRGAHHYFHIDNRGEGTWLEVATGEKIWIFAEFLDPSGVSSTEFWTNPDLDVSKLDYSKLHMEAILLRAGDRM